MQPRLDDANIEFQFSDLEKIAAKFLDPVKIAWLQTKYAETWKIKASTPVPEDPAADRSYFLKMAELDGYMIALKDLMDGHKEAMMELNTRRQAGEQVNFSTTEQNLAEKAASLVHKIPTGT